MASRVRHAVNSWNGDPHGWRLSFQFHAIRRSLSLQFGGNAGRSTTSRVSATPMRAGGRIARWLRHAASVPLALLILFEEWGWVPLERLIAFTARLPFFASTERRIAALPPYAALVTYLLPWLVLLPVKVFALSLIGDGRALLGLASVVVAKVIGTAVVARLFTLTKPALLKLRWFASLYARWGIWKEAMTSWLLTSEIWCRGVAVKHELWRRWKMWRQLRRV